MARFLVMINGSLKLESYEAFLRGQAEASHTCHCSTCWSVLMICGESHAINILRKDCAKKLAQEVITDCSIHRPECVSVHGSIVVDMPRCITIDLSNLNQNDLKIFCKYFPSLIKARALEDPVRADSETRPSPPRSPILVPSQIRMLTEEEFEHTMSVLETRRNASLRRFGNRDWSGLRALECFKCREDFVDRTDFLSHLRNLHGVEVDDDQASMLKPFACAGCGDVFSTNLARSLHVSNPAT